MTSTKNVLDLKSKKIFAAGIKKFCMEDREVLVYVMKCLYLHTEWARYCRFLRKYYTWSKICNG